LSDKEDNPSPAPESTRETQSARDVEKLFSTLNLGHSHYQRFGQPRANPATSQEPPGSTTMDVASTTSSPLSTTPITEALPQERLRVGFYSPMGGSGKSLLTASIGALLCQLGWRIAMIDTSPWQTLSFYFGAQKVKPGMRTFSVPGGDGTCVHILNYNPSFTSSDLSSFMSTTPVDCVLLDLGGLCEDNALAWLKTCDHIVIPLLPAVQAPIIASATRERILALGFNPRKFMFVLNSMDQTPVVVRTKKLLGELLHEQLLPSAIEHQQIVDEALSERIVLPYFAPNSQAVNVCREIVNWFSLPEREEKRTARRWIEE
jgi:MinD-like ATPase involved in chromosome partitioning or flagellar assembly